MVEEESPRYEHKFAVTLRKRNTEILIFLPISLRKGEGPQTRNTSGF